jgi:hypothetical protein
VRLGRRVRGSLSSLALVAILGSFVGLFVYRDRYERKQWAEAEEARVAPVRAVFEQGGLGERLRACREAWAGQLSLGQEPVAVAWSREGVDAYFYQGVDQASLRQARCSARGVSRGPRVSHPLHAWLPAEAPARAEPEAESSDEWARALAAAAGRSFGDRELVFELVRHPATGAALSRTWRSGPEAVEAKVEPDGTPAFAFLGVSAGFRPGPAARLPALDPLPRHRWLSDPEAAFALLARELPKGARISELRLEEDGIDVQIEWPTPGFDGGPPHPYGDKSFDEYGVADLSWWYPRESPAFGCPRGEPLERVRETFGMARGLVGERLLASAWLSCSPAYSNGREGTWHLVPQ